MTSDEPSRTSHIGSGIDPSLRTRARLRLMRMSDVTPEAVMWLWPGRVPLGKLTLLVGDPEAGKTFVSLDLAARVSRGAPWPDGDAAPLGNVILFVVEDGIADTIRPRLDALSADPHRITVANAVQLEGEKQRTFSLENDIPLLERAICEEGARLVVVDPLNNYLGGKTNSNRDPDVRTILTPLAQMAERTNVAVVGIMHLNKNEEQGLLHRVQGSIGFVAVARVVLNAKRHTNEDRRTLSVLKNNLAEKSPDLVYRITRDGRLEWEQPGAATAAADEINETQRAIQFLTEQLALEDRAVADVKRAAGEAGITASALRRATKRLRIKARRATFAGRAWTYPVLTPVLSASVPPVTMVKMVEMGDGHVAQPDHLNPPYIGDTSEDLEPSEPPDYGYASLLGETYVADPWPARRRGATGAPSVLRGAR